MTLIIGPASSATGGVVDVDAVDALAEGAVAIAEVAGGFTTAGGLSALHPIARPHPRIATAMTDRLIPKA